jgi:hypothetical protein
MTEQGVGSLERRLARLERENRWFKRLGSVGLLGLATLVLMGQARPARVPDVIEAKSFIVRDGNGQPRAKLGVEPDGLAGLLLFDQSGKARGGFSVVADGRTTIELLDQAANERILLFARSDGTPGLMMKDGTGSARVKLSVLPQGTSVFGLSSGPTNANRFLVTVGVDKVSVNLADDDDNQRVTLGVSGSTSIVVIFDKDGKPVWKAP